MASEKKWSCPICYDITSEWADVTPCHHQFCLHCIQLWVDNRQSCPLCRQTIRTIICSSGLGEAQTEIEVEHPSGSVSDESEEEQEEEQEAAEAVLGAAEQWARIFQEYPEILQPVRTWLDESAPMSGRLLGDSWWELHLFKAFVILNLCKFGLDEAALVWVLHPFLQDQTERFVSQLIDFAQDHCNEEICQQLGLQMARAPEEEADSPAATPGLATSLGGNPISSLAAQEEPHEELGQAMADPSEAGQVRARSWGQHQQHSHRRASNSRGSSANKRPWHNQD